MTPEEIQELVDAIKVSTKNAMKSRQAAENFLISAGIIEDETKAHKKKKKRVQQSSLGSYRLS